MGSAYLVHPQCLNPLYHIHGASSVWDPFSAGLPDAPNPPSAPCLGRAETVPPTVHPIVIRPKTPELKGKRPGDQESFCSIVRGCHLVVRTWPVVG